MEVIVVPRDYENTVQNLMDEKIKYLSGQGFNVEKEKEVSDICERIHLLFERDTKEAVGAFPTMESYEKAAGRSCFPPDGGF